MDALRNENKALKKQLSAVNNAEELLAKLTIASDQAKSLHDSMMVERKHSAEQSLQSRKLREEQDAAYEARHRNSMEAMRKQVMNLYDSQAETQSMLEEIKAGREEFRQTKKSLMQSHEWIMENMNVKREELEKFAAKDYVDQQLTAREQEGLTRLQQEHLDRNLRLFVSDPTAFAQRIQESAIPAQPEPPNFEA